MKKKLIALLLCTTMVAAMSGCGKDKGESVDDTEGTEVSSAAVEYDPLDYVKLGDYMGVEVSLTDDYTVSDADVQSFIETNVIANYPYYTDSDKTTIETGDFVNIDYEGTQDGTAFDGGTEAGRVLEIGSGSFIDGFEDGLIGAKVGDVLDLPLTFPENYQNTDMAGKEVNFHVTVNKIVDKQDLTFDTLDDDYVAYMCEQSGMTYTTVDEMVADARAYLESSEESSKQSAIRTAILNKLADICPVDKLPDGLLEARMSEVLAQYESYYCKDGSSLKDYVVDTMGQDYDAFLSDITDEVKADLESQIILEAIAAKEEVAFDEEGFTTYSSNLMSNYGYTDEDTLYESYGSTTKAGKAYLQNVYVCNLALQKVVDAAEVSYDTESVTDTEALSDTETE